MGSILFKRKKKDEFGEEVEESVDELALKKVGKASADFEKVKAKVDVLSELRATDTERFSHISEQIGELRNLILEKEKDIKDATVKAETASDMVNELKPEAILGELRKGIVQIEIVKAKNLSNEEITKRVMEELKALRQKIMMFKGVETLIKLNEETGENLNTMKKIQTLVEKESAKVENTFIQQQKQTTEFRQFKDWVEAAQEEYKKILKELDSLKIKAEASFIGRKDLNTLKKKLQGNIDELSRKVQKGKEGVTKEKLKLLETNTSSLKTELAAVSSSLKKTDELLAITETGTKNFAFEPFKTEFLGKIESMKKELGEMRERKAKQPDKILTNKVQELENQLEALTEINSQQGETLKSSVQDMENQISIMKQEAPKQEKELQAMERQIMSFHEQKVQQPKIELLEKVQKLEEQVLDLKENKTAKKLLEEATTQKITKVEKRIDVLNTKIFEFVSMLKDLGQTVSAPKIERSTKQYPTLIKEIKNLIANGMVEEALNKYNDLKDAYLEMAEHTTSLKEKEVLYAELKDAFAAVNVAVRDDPAFHTVTTPK